MQRGHGNNHMLGRTTDRPEDETDGRRRVEMDRLSSQLTFSPRLSGEISVKQLVVLVMTQAKGEKNANALESESGVVPGEMSRSSNTTEYHSEGRVESGNTRITIGFVACMKRSWRQRQRRRYRRRRRQRHMTSKSQHDELIFQDVAQKATRGRPNL